MLSIDTQLIANPDQLDPAQIIALYVAVGWGTAEQYNEEKIRQAWSHSTFTAIARSDHQVIGAIRSLSDDNLTTWIPELLVHPAYQTRGIGGQLLQCVIHRYGHTAIYLETYTGVETFFERHGLQPRRKMIVCSRAAASNDQNKR